MIERVLPPLMLLVLLAFNKDVDEIIADDLRARLRRSNIRKAAPLSKVSPTLLAEAAVEVCDVLMELATSLKAAVTSICVLNMKAMR